MMYGKISWWYWLITVGLIAVGLAGWAKAEIMSYKIRDSRV